MAKQSRPKISLRSKSKEKQKEIKETSLKAENKSIETSKSAITTDVQQGTSRPKVHLDIKENNEREISFDPIKVRNSLQIQFLIIFLLGSLIIWLNLFPAIIQIGVSALLMFVFVIINFNKTRS